MLRNLRIVPSHPNDGGRLQGRATASSTCLRDESILAYKLAYNSGSN